MFSLRSSLTEVLSCDMSSFLNFVLYHCLYNHLFLQIYLTINLSIYHGSGLITKKRLRARPACHCKLCSPQPIVLSNSRLMDWLPGYSDNTKTIKSALVSVYISTATTGQPFVFYIMLLLSTSTQTYTLSFCILLSSSLHP